MSLEQKIEELTVAVAELTVAMGNNASVPEETLKEVPVKKVPAKRGRPKKVGPTQAEARNALSTVSKKMGKPVAQAVLQEFGVKKFVDIESSDYPELIEACEEAMNKEEDEGDEEEEDDI